MKATYACFYGPPQKIELREREIEPREDEVMVRIVGCGICSYDLFLFKEEHSSPVPIGHESLGQVIAKGPWVKNLSEGDLVVGDEMLGFANYSLGPERNLFKVSAELGEMWCLAEPLACVTNVVRAAAPDFMDTVVVVGCGFMGLSVIAELKGAWLKNLIALDTVDSRRSLAMSFGATHAFDPRDPDLKARIHDLSSGRDADVAIEFAGNPEAATLAASLLGVRSKLVLAGGCLPKEKFLHPEIYFKALTVYHVPPAFSSNMQDNWRRAIEAVNKGIFPVKQLVTHRFKLSEIQSAFETAIKGNNVGYMKGIVLNDIG